LECYQARTENHLIRSNPNLNPKFVFKYFTAGVREQGTDENIWTEKARSDGREEKAA
jgi:hypothetical protein